MQNNVKTRKHRTHEQYVEELKELRPNIEIIDTFINMVTKVKHRCKVCGHEWSPTPHDMLSKNKGNCPNCSKMRAAEKLKRQRYKIGESIIDNNRNITIIDVKHEAKSNGHKIWFYKYKCNKCEVELASLKNQRRKIKAVEYKGGKCELCNYDKNISALEFHHLNPEEKDFTISGYKCKWEVLKKELDKCILVCSNCHREIHNPQSTIQNIKEMVEKHKIDVQIKVETHKRNRPSKYKFTLEEVEKKKIGVF